MTKFLTVMMVAVLGLGLTGCLEEEPNSQAAVTEAVEENVAEPAPSSLGRFQLVAQGDDVPAQELPYSTSMTIRTAAGETYPYRLELALTPKDQQRGMMGRNFVPEDYGMLFVFEQPYTQGFWMKHVLVPLDMLFIAEDGRIHHIHHMAEPLSEDSIRGEESSRAVLEIKGGQAEERNIQVGDYVLHDAFTPPEEESP